MLAYDNRAVALELLRPPTGSKLDFAVVLSYTLNLEALLALPLAVVSHQEAGVDELLQDPIRLLQSLREVGDKIHVFVDETGVHVPQRRHPVFVALESCVHLVRAPNSGVFHPKLWVARFIQSDGTPCIRVAILSRNLTYDRSLDLALVSEASPGEENVSGSEPIRDLLEELTSMSRPRIPKNLSNRLNTLGEETSRCEFLPPEGFYQSPIEFQPIGIPGYPQLNLNVEHGKRVLAVAPFVNRSALDDVRVLGANESRLISRPDELDTVPAECLEEWNSVSVLDDDINESDVEMVDEDESNEDSSSSLSGLHAKFVVVEHKRSKASWTLGSANLTAGAFNGHNVEIVAQLWGRVNRVGIDTVWKEIERFCQDYKSPNEEIEPSAEEQNARNLLNQAKRDFLDSQSLKISCTQEDSGGLWEWSLIGKFKIDQEVKVHAWPISVNNDECKELQLPVSWKSMPEERLISFVAFRFSVQDFPDLDESFVLNLPISGVSHERVDKVLRSVIDSTEKLLLFLRLLLGENHDDWIVSAENGTKVHDVFYEAGFALETLLEDLLRVASRHPKRLEPFQRLMSNLKETSEGRALIPEQLETLWQAVEQALTK
ncbi:MAG: phospholipase D family protein [Gammaproteobacteria bacterium]|nr:phospholipase D family protein [Gammaproteobacteria bacterium]